ncbi:penicillin-binding transpeptidase domain-containing protein [uncultured Clostridium sp.]|uniref:penicillin-binding transpeptidase domain-containing protein n=1 Tax=uncultured Clostridium sp. TaxID=59620 RepID=UPI00262BD551|nr:penicillin-binding transpeptidase domain-containing protein [uncultured Clostridium sp.]
MKGNKKMYTIMGCAALGLIVLGGFVLKIGTDKSEQVITEYTELVNDREYEKMYNLISSESKNSISKEDFVARNKNIYEGMNAENINVKVLGKFKEDKNIINYDMTMNTMAGEVKFSNSAKVKKENKEYKIVWDSELILPELTDDSKIRVNSDKSKRGSILDRNGEVLASDDFVSEVGIVPGKLGENKEKKIKQIAEILETTVEGINNKLGASYVRDDMFIPIKSIPKDDDRGAKLLTISGVMIDNKKARVYPYGKEAAHLTGYVQNINAEELETGKDKGYTGTSVIGKAGIELLYEDTLRGIDGVEIYIVDGGGNRTSTVATKDIKNGEDLKLTVDKSVQIDLYNEFKDDKGASIAMNHQTGELLALVSIPGYDPNDFVLGMNEKKWNALNEDANKPLYNRFQSVVAPGSVFKPITAAIGLDEGKIKPEDNRNISGLKWQKDSTWGSYYVTRVKEYGTNTNLLNAMVYSDNIYFAQAALDIGKDTFSTKLKALGFGESLPLQYEMKKSQYAADDKFKTDVQLADTGYGQGEMLVNPVHLASLYSMFVNDGSMVEPYLEYKDKKERKLWKENAISKEATDVVLNDMIQVVGNPNGTGNGAKIEGLTIAGKTGTAEVKLTQDDTKGTEIGWFVGMTTNKENMLVVSMVDDVKDRGGSHYVVPKVKKILEKTK